MTIFAVLGAPLGESWDVFVCSGYGLTYGTSLLDVLFDAIIIFYGFDVWFGFN